MNAIEEELAVRGFNIGYLNKFSDIFKSKDYLVAKM